MSDTLKGRRLRGGIRPSKSFDEGRVCSNQHCETKLSRYNKREYCHAHAPVKFPRVRGRIIPEST